MESTYILAIILAFLIALVAKGLKLPPLVGFLAAGFLLSSQGMKSGDFINTIADMGVTLLLFTIGLKLRIKDLLVREVWASASAHMILITVIVTLGVKALAFSGLSMLSGLDNTSAMLLAFALSFSSTVFAVKVLEDQGERSSLHARVAIGVLIIQDIVAVLFMAYSKGVPPSPWAVLLLLLIPGRRILNWIAVRCGHSELLILYGMMLAFIGAYLFEFLGIKGDFGALVIGMLLAPYAKAEEISKVLMHFKDIMLVGFFLSIGLSGSPTAEHFWIAGLLLLFIPLKMLGYFALLVTCKLRARTALLTTFSLANFSEFGLIIVGVSAKAGWLNADWLIVIALSMSMSFILASPLNAQGKEIYRRWHDLLIRYQKKDRISGDEILDPGKAEILIFGMGKVGATAYEAMAERYGDDKLIGIDNDQDVVNFYRTQGRHVILGDPTDVDFWERKSKIHKVKLIMLAMSNQYENRQAAKLIRSTGFDGCLSATAHHEDEIEELTKLGVNAAYNIYGNAGAAFAGYICEYEQSDRQ